LVQVNFDNVNHVEIKNHPPNYGSGYATFVDPMHSETSWSPPAFKESHGRDTRTGTLNGMAISTPTFNRLDRTADLSTVIPRSHKLVNYLCSMRHYCNMFLTTAHAGLAFFVRETSRYKMQDNFLPHQFNPFEEPDLKLYHVYDGAVSDSILRNPIGRYKFVLDALLAPYYR
jgi:hypothetical protein